MELLTPGVGLIFWQTVVFLILFFLLAKLAWKPILNSLKEREVTIQTSLDMAVKAKEEMAALKADNEILLKEAREERDKILQTATKAANVIRDKAKQDAIEVGNKMIEDAKETINSEKLAALREIKDQVAILSLEITEKLLRKNLSNDKAQKELLDSYIDELKLN